MDPKNSPIFAAIDIGTNSVHLAIARYHPDNGIEIIDSEKNSIQLGKSLSPLGELAPEAIERCVDTVDNYVQISKGYTNNIRIVATHAVRVATNQAKLIEAIQSRSHIATEVIDGIEEARMCSLGIKEGLHLDDEAYLALDIGGGSTEIAIFRGNTTLYASSLKLGAVTLTTKYSNIGNAKARYSKIRESVYLQLAPLISIAHKHKYKYKAAICSSGTAKAIATLDAGRNIPKDARKEALNGHVFSQSSLKKIRKSLFTPNDGTENLPVNQRRAQILPAGTCILEAISDVFSIDEWQYSEYSLREGIIVDAFQRQNGEQPASENIRLRSIKSFGRKYKIDEAYSDQIAKFSLAVFSELFSQLFPQTEDTEKNQLRSALEAAAYLVEAGKYLSLPNFQKHSSYIVKNSTIPGFTENEKQLISAIIRHHRKAPKRGSSEETKFANANRSVLSFLGGCLRLATCLERTRRGSVENIKIKYFQHDRTIELSVVASQAYNVEPELAKLDSEKQVLEKSLGAKLIICLGMS